MIGLPDNWDKMGHRSRTVFFGTFAIHQEVKGCPMISGYDLSNASPDVKREFRLWEMEKEKERKKGLGARKY